jgi:xylulose-5-phosphate/fructose-6-phosphate phosphoketolase
VLVATRRRGTFAFHGYPWLMHRLTYRRTDHDNLHVRGDKEEGTTTAYLKQMLHEKLIEHREYVTRYGDDTPEVRDFTWDGGVRNDGGRARVL